MSSYALISAEIVVLVTAVLVLFSDVITRGMKRGSAWLGVAGSLLAAGCALWAGQGEVRLFGGMLVMDGIAVFARVATALLTALFLLWLAGKGLGNAGRVREAVALALLASLGAMLMAAARDYVVLFLALETATMPAYVLMGYDRRDDRGLEGAMKYFLLSMITSVTMLYGLSFVIGVSGSTAYAGTTLSHKGVLALIAVALVAVGLLAKLSAAPFHYWSPDAYSGAPVGAVAFVSSVPKIAGTVALARIAMVFGEQVPAFFTIIAAVAAVSMVLGNLAAFPQKDLRRLMAYSGVAHAGYLLLAISAASTQEIGMPAAVFYSLAYALPSMGMMFVAADGGVRLEGIAGLAKRRPAMAWGSVVLLASLVGIPPLAGFVGKLHVFSSALNANMIVLTVLGVLMSAVSAGYYLRIVRAEFFEESASAPAKEADRGAAADVAFWLCVTATVALGLLADPVLNAIGLAL